MKYLQSVSVYYWSANHIAMNLTQNDYAYDNGKFSQKYGDEGEPIKVEKFRALSHDSDAQTMCLSKRTPALLKDLINTWFDNKKKKIPSFIEDFWEDCSLYIRPDQLACLKALYQIILEHHVLVDDEDLEDAYDDDDVPDNIDDLRELGVDVRLGSEKREESLTNAAQYELLLPLIQSLRTKTTPDEKKQCILEFVEQLKDTKGLGINLSDTADEDIMYGKLPSKAWELPLGNSLTLNPSSDDYLENLNLFGLNPKGIESGVRKFQDVQNIVHRGIKETYYKFFSRYHNCCGYTRFLLEQGGITAFESTNELEKFGVTDPAKFDAYMSKVLRKITRLNDQARELIKNAGVIPVPLTSVDQNFLIHFKKGEPDFDILPKKVRNLIDHYNRELPEVSYEYKINLLSQLVNTMYHLNVRQPAVNGQRSTVIDALQKEIRRNYEINFSAQFSHNHTFELQCLGALSAISVAALAVGILAIACPFLIPITLAAAVTIIAISAVTTGVGIGLFIKKTQPQTPTKEDVSDLTQSAGTKTA